MPVIAGAGSNSTDEAIALTRHAKEVGADAVLSVTGYYNKPIAGRPVPPFHGDRRGGGHSDPALQHPGRTIVEISVETMARLSSITNIIGVKDATANLMRPTRERAACGRNCV